MRQALVAKLDAAALGVEDWGLPLGGAFPAARFCPLRHSPKLWERPRAALSAEAGSLASHPTELSARESSECKPSSPSWGAGREEVEAWLLQVGGSGFVAAPVEGSVGLGLGTPNFHVGGGSNRMA